jgi:hypothetical protein
MRRRPSRPRGPLWLGVLLTLALRCSLGDVPPSQRAALLQLYDSTAGASWIASDGWGSATSPCGWFGVHCDDGNTTVQALLLFANNLQGTLCDDLSQLTGVTRLDLFANPLVGTIPAAIGQLPVLV